jgi:sugar phosphate isomerase/epimerase
MGASAFTAYEGSLDEFCAILRRLGFFHIELRNFIGDDSCIAPESEASVREALRSWGLTSTIHAPWRQNLAADIPVEREEAIRQHTLAVEMASRLGSKHVVFHGGWHADREAGQRLSLRSIDALLERAEAQGVCLALENEEAAPSRPTLFQHPADFHHIELPTLGYVLDVGHANTLGYSSLDFLPVFGGRLREVHLHDNHGGRDRHLAVGEGTIDWPATASSLASYEDVTFVVESKSIENLEKSAEALKWLVAQ